jgi:hypothetical protein
MNPETRFSGQWIVARQGAGKTNLLLNMLCADLQRNACIITIDPKGELTKAIKDLDLGERLVLIDPSEPFAFNPLDVPKTDIKRATNQVEYIFRAMLDTATTDKQKSLLRALIRACIIAFPNPSLQTIQDLIVSGLSNYLPYIDKLPPDLKSVFDTTPKTGEWHSYDGTRTELKWRLRTLLESELIQKMFSAPSTRFRISDAMDSGKIVVIDNSEEKVHSDGAKFLGRYFIAQIWMAATARSIRPQHEKPPVYVYIDEADLVIDETVAEIIDRCRSQRIALILAHQRVSQIQDKTILGALENCAIKMANVNASETAYFSKHLYIPEERLTNLLVPPAGSQFAAHIRGEPKESSIFDIPKASLPFPEMNAKQQSALRDRMRSLYGIEQPASPKKNPDLVQSSEPPPAKPSTAQPTPSTLPNRTGSYEWDITVSPRIAQNGGSIPLVVQKKGTPTKIEVTIPPKTAHNSVIRLVGFGYLRADNTYGDLYLTVKVPPAPQQDDPDSSSEW